MNKYQNSLNLLKNWAKNDRKAFSPTHWENIEKHSKNLQELVDKETPRKVVSNTNIEPYWVCPVCGNFLIEKSEASSLKPFVKHVFLDGYCHKCGQRLDWSEVDE